MYFHLFEGNKPESESGLSSTAEGGKERRIHLDGRRRIGSTSTREMREGKSPIHQLGGD